MPRQENGKSSIYKGSDGYWHGRVTVGLTDEGRIDRRHVMGAQKKTVVEKVRVLEKARDAGQLHKPGERWTVEEWLVHWLENISRPFVKPNTYDGYRVAVHRHLIPAIGKQRLTSLRPEHLERMYVRMLTVKTRRGTMTTPGRVHQVHRTCRTALNEAVKRGYLQRNPASLAKTPAQDDAEVEPYTVGEIKRLFAAAASTRNGARWVVALALGLRQGEALGLQWENVDWENRTLAIRRNALRPKYEHGCRKPCGRKYAGHCPDRKRIRPETSTTKSKAGKRYIPLPEAIVLLLRRQQEEQAAERTHAGSLWTEGGWMFTTETGDILNPRTDWTRWKQLLAAAHVRDGRLHDARHTAATVLLLLGVHEQTMMRLMGWSTTAMASRYAHVTASLRREVADQVGDLLWDASGTAAEPLWDA
jgi:integrase